MAICSDLIKICKGCWTVNAGSETKLYLIDIKGVDLDTIQLDADNVIVGATFSSDWIEIELTKNAASSDQTKPADPITGGGLYTQVLNVTIPFRDKDKRNAIASFAAGQRDMWAATKDGNNIGWLYGYLRGVNLSNVSVQSTADLNTGSQYVLTFTGMENEESHPINLGIITGTSSYTGGAEFDSCEE